DAAAGASPAYGSAGAWRGDGPAGAVPDGRWADGSPGDGWAGSPGGVSGIWATRRPSGIGDSPVRGRSRMRNVRGAWSSEAAGPAAAAAARHRIAACFVVPMLHRSCVEYAPRWSGDAWQNTDGEVWRDRHIAAFSSTTVWWRCVTVQVHPLAPRGHRQTAAAT